LPVQAAVAKATTIDIDRAQAGARPSVRPNAKAGPLECDLIFMAQF